MWSAKNFICGIMKFCEMAVQARFYMGVQNNDRLSVANFSSESPNLLKHVLSKFLTLRVLLSKIWVLICGFCEKNSFQNPKFLIFPQIKILVSR